MAMIPMTNTTMDMRLGGIYRNMLKGNYRTAIRATNATIQNLRDPDLCFFDRRTQNKVEDNLYRALVNLATRNYQGAHSYIRELHYVLNA
jgi:hypothetical protein